MRSPSKASFTFVDHFCGGGGSSIGLTEAGGQLVLAANHWERAIETHAYNFPNAEHLIADLSGYDMRRMPRADVLWSSPECTWHSPAGGRKRVRADDLDLFDDHVPSEAGDRSRMTMFDVIRAAEAKAYKVIVVENVVEVTQWPLFEHWLKSFEILGYEHQILCVSSAHIGSETNPYAPQWRDRIYFVFSKKGMKMPDIAPRPIAWCSQCDAVVESVQSWKPKATNRIGKYGPQYVYVCAAGKHSRHVVEPFILPASSAIDWSDLGERIGDKPLKKFKDKKTGEVTMGHLAPATMRRIAVGARMFAEPVVVAHQGQTYDAASPSHPLFGDPEAYHRVNPVSSPLNARSGTPGDAVSVPPFMLERRDYDGPDESRLAPVTDPVKPITATGRGTHTVVVPPFMIERRYYEGADEKRISGVDEPIKPITAAHSPHTVVVPPFVDVARSNNRAGSIDEPLSPITTGRNHAVVNPSYITEFWGTSTARSIDDPLSSVTAGGNHHALTTPDGAFLSRAYGSRGSGAHLNTPVSDPLHPITASGGNHALVIPYRRNGKAYRPAERPLGTMSTKSHAGLLREELGLELLDFKFRVLGPREHLRAQRFPDSYVVKGNKGEQTMQAGNAVSSNVAHYIGEKIALAFAA